jgi:hypothetical protein
MRWTFVLFITLLAFLGQAQDATAVQSEVVVQDKEEDRENIAFLIQPIGDDTIQLEPIIRSLGDRFRLEPITPDKVYEDKDAAAPVLPKLTASQVIIPLGNKEAPACNGLWLGQVSFAGEITTQTLEDLENALQDAGVTVLGVDGNSSYGSDMAKPSKSGGEKQFFESANINDAQSLVVVSNTIIAILDTGMSTTALIPHASQADFIEFDSTPQDEYEDYMNGSLLNKGHGTPIALLAHSVAPNAAILPIRVCNDEGQCETTRVILGVCHALNVAAKEKKQLIFNLSFSGVFPAGFDPMKSALYEVLNRALRTGALIATEVGNRGLDPNPRYPAAFTNAGMNGLVSVSGLETYGSSFAPAYYSTRGNYIDVAALGSDIFVDTQVMNGNSYSGGYSGSSFATPWVAGALSLMADANAQRQFPLQRLTPWELEYCLQTTTQPPMPSVVAQHEVGSGMIDIQAAVTCVLLFPNYP